MKKVSIKVARPITVQLNTDNIQKDQWMKIQCAKTGYVLHTGQPTYIKKLAKERYNHKVV